MANEYKADRPTTLGPLDSEEIRENFQILERFNRLRVVPVEGAADPTVRINGGTIVVGDRLVDVSEQQISYDGTEYSLPDASICSDRTDLVVINHTGNAKLIEGEPGGDAPALPKGVYSAALLHVQPEMDQIEDKNVTDTRMFNVAGTDSWWESGPTFQREATAFDDGSTVQDLPDGMSYDPGAGNLVVVVDGDFKYPDTDYEEINPTQIDWISGQEPTDGQSVLFIRMSGDGTTRYFSDRNDQKFGGDNPVELDFFYTVGTGSINVYHEGELLTPGVHYQEVGDASQPSQKIKFEDKVNLQVGDWISFLKMANFPDYTHGYKHVPGDDPIPKTAMDHIGVEPSDVDVFYEALNDDGHSTIEFSLDRSSNVFKLRSFSRNNFARKVEGVIRFFGTGLSSFSALSTGPGDSFTQDGNEFHFSMQTGGGGDGADLQLTGSPNDALFELRLTNLDELSGGSEDEPTVDFISYGNSILRRDLKQDEPEDEHQVFRCSLIPNYEENFARTDKDERFNHDLRIDGDTEIGGTLKTGGWITEGANL